VECCQAVRITKIILHFYTTWNLEPLCYHLISMYQHEVILKYHLLHRIIFAYVPTISACQHELINLPSRASYCLCGGWGLWFRSGLGTGCYDVFMFFVCFTYMPLIPNWVTMTWVDILSTSLLINRPFTWQCIICSVGSAKWMNE